ncbi:MAG: RluA family pseudouridine synthase [Oscillospiraceae bacterium]|jgi:23S rRNA pseudouridine1911/1915/1917 synthase|nr:RluA family pseudouridine synthase [Oscillospiraceae bacterium]
MRILTFTVPPEYEGRRALGFLRNYCGLSARTLAKLKRVEQGISINNQLLRSIDILCAGALVTIRIPEFHPPAQAVPLAIDILYEDEDLLVCSKPPNMPVHSSAGHGRDTLANAVAYHLEAKGEFLAFRPINRLDKDTSGLVLCAKNARSAVLLAKSVSKLYYAICEGEINGEGTIDLPLGYKEGHGIQRAVVPEGQRAVTHYKALEQARGLTLLEIRLETGRTHQIRAHFAHLGHPLAGDDMYGGGRELIIRQALHCGMLRFAHPTEGREIEIALPLPEDMVGLIRNA